MKRKQIVTMLLLLLVLAGMAAGYVIFKNYDDEKKQEEEQQKEDDKTISIFDINTDEVAGITYAYKNNSIDIVNDGGLWMQDETGIPMKEENIQEMLDAVSSVKAIKVITEDMSNLKEYGLDSPEVSYTIKMQDGSSHNIRLGIPLATEDTAYYAILDDEQKVYAVSSNYYEPFTRTLVEMTDIVDKPDVKADYITGVEVNTEDGLDIAVKHMDEKSVSGYYKWEIMRPYKNVLADTDRWKEKLTAYASLEYKNCVAYDAEDYGKYDLAEPYATVKLNYYTVKGESEDTVNDDEDDNQDNAQATPVPESEREYHELILYISRPHKDGSGDDEKEVCYVRQDGSANIYETDASEAEKMYQYTAYDVADACIYSELIDNIKGYDVEYGDTRLVVERKDEKPETTPEPGEVKKKKKDTINVYYVNGKKVEEKEALDLYSFAYLLEYSGEADPDKKDVSDKPVLTITYHPVEGEDVVVKFLPYDGDNFYHVDRNGMKYFLTDKRGIDTLIKNYEKFIKENL